MDNAVHHRIHPLTIVIEAARFIGRFAFVIVILLISRSAGGGFDAFELVLAALGVFSIAAATMRYMFTTYSLDSQNMIIRTGVVFRQKRTIPLARIQNVEIKRGVLHQLLGLSDLKIETAGGAEAEGDLSALTVAEAERLKDLLMRAKHADAPVSAEAPPPPPQRQTVWIATAKDLLILGATENRAFVVIGIILAPLFFAPRISDDLVERFGSQMFQSVRGIGDDVWLIAIWATAGLLVFGWIASIVMTAVHYYGFALRYQEGQFQRRYGLFTTVESIVPLPRIQSLCIEAPLLRRLLGYVTIHAGLAGSIKLGEQQQATSALCLLVKSKDVAEYVRRVFPHLNMNDIEWSPVSRIAIRRGAFRVAFLPTLALVGWVVYSGNNLALLALIPIIALAIWYGYARYRALGYSITDGFLITREGILYRKIHIAPHGKLQWLAVSQGPIQRRYRIADLDVGTAAVVGAQLGSPSIVDLELDKAENVQDFLSARVEASGLWMPDGV